MASYGPCLAATNEHRFRGAASLEERQVAVDELVVVNAHAAIVDDVRDT
jgi:hypothetical protein